MKTSLHRLFHAARPVLWSSAAFALSISYSPEAAAQGKKSGRVDIGEATGGQPGAPGGQPGFPGGQPGFPGSGGGAAPANLGPAKVPAYKLTPRKYKDALVEAGSDLAKGVPFNVAKFLQLPAEADNAAPLVLDALAELPDVYQAVAADGTPKEEFEKGLKERQDRLKAANDWIVANPNPRQWDSNAIEQGFEGYRVLFAKLHDAHKKTDCVIASPVDSAPPPHVQAAFDVARIGTVLIYADLARGDHKGAVEKFADILLLGIDLQPRARIEAGITVANIHMILLRETLPILLNSRLTEKDCDGILAALKTYRESTTNLLPEMLKADFVNSAIGLDKFTKPGALSAMLNDMPNKPAELANVDMKMLESLVAPIFTPENGEKMKAAMGAVLKDQLAAIDAVASPEDVAALGGKLNDLQQKGLKEGLGAMLKKEPGAADAAKGKSGGLALDPSLLLGGVISQALKSAPDFQFIVNSIMIYQTQQGMMEALTATRKWYLTKKATTNGKTLEEVTKAAGLEAAPLDSFSGKPLKLIWTGSGPAVYSVGPDRKDDDGKLLLGTVGEDQKPSTKGDMIVTLALGGNPLGEAGAAGAGGAVPGGFGGQPGAPGVPGGYGGQPGSGGPPQAIAPGGPGGRRGRGDSGSGSSGGGPPQAIAPGPGNRGGSGSGGSTAPGGASQAISPR